MKILLTLLLLVPGMRLAVAQDNTRFHHILITNDDGIGDAERLLALAESVKSVSDRVSIVVPSFDRSGASNRTVFGKYQSTLEVTCEYLDRENNIAVYVVPGDPSDCVLIGLNGLFEGDRPDLVLSGINGGANIGAEWFRSGTIGAIRSAAFMGVPGIALSGFNDDDQRSFQVIPRWVTQLISSGIMDEIDKNSYLTVGFPDVPLEEVKGVKIADRRITVDKPEAMVFYKILGDDPHEVDNKTVWSFRFAANPYDLSVTSDDTFLNYGYIVITPMTIDENNPSLMKKLQAKKDRIPDFQIQ